MFKIGDMNISGSTITAIGSMVAAVVFMFNVYSDLKTKIDKIEKHDTEFHEVEKRMRAMECYMGVVRCDGVFSNVFAPAAPMMLEEVTPYIDEYDAILESMPVEAEPNGDN